MHVHQTVGSTPLVGEVYVARLASQGCWSTTCNHGNNWDFQVITYIMKRVFNVFPLKVCVIYSQTPSQQPTHLHSWTKLLGYLNSRPLPPSPPLNVQVSCERMWRQYHSVNEFQQSSTFGHTEPTLNGGAAGGVPTNFVQDCSCIIP